MADRPFKLVSEYEPRGDQPGHRASCSTGSSAATSTRCCSASPAPARPSRSRNVIAQHAAPDADHRAQQDAGGAALRRVQGALPRERRRVLRQLLRLLPARGLRPVDRHVHREGLDHQRRDRSHAPLGDARAARRGATSSSSPSSRASTASARAESYHGLLVELDVGRGAPPRRAAAPARRDPVRAQRRRLPPRHLPRARRRRRDLPRLRGGDGAPHRVLRRRDREHQRGRPAARQGACARSSATPIFPGVALRDARATQLRARHRRRSATSCASGCELLDAQGKLLEKQRLEQRTHVRPRDARADGLLQRHRELLAPPLRARSRASRRRR